MNKTKIDWADSTWNPVTGCLHGCEYCYARGQANRFKGFVKHSESSHSGKIHDLQEPFYKTNGKCNYIKAPYPYNFDPTFHRYRLDDYKTKKSRTIFVGSMTDLFGEWVPDEWIQEVFKACETAPQHRYLFLTKNPARYIDLDIKHILTIPQYDNKFMWYGTTITDTSKKDIERCKNISMIRARDTRTFISIEPLHYDVTEVLKRYSHTDWVIIGAETGNRKDKIVPKREWIENIVNECRQDNIPIFMKSSLADIWGEPLVQEYPWD